MGRLYLFYPRFIQCLYSFLTQTHENYSQMKKYKPNFLTLMQRWQRPTHNGWIKHKLFIMFSTLKTNYFNQQKWPAHISTACRNYKNLKMLNLGDRLDRLDSGVVMLILPWLIWYLCAKLKNLNRVSNPPKTGFI